MGGKEAVCSEWLIWIFSSFPKASFSSFLFIPLFMSQSAATPKTVSEMYLLNSMGSFLGDAELPFRVLQFFGDVLDTTSFHSSLLPACGPFPAAHFLNMLVSPAQILLHRCGVLAFSEATVGTWADLLFCFVRNCLSECSGLPILQTLSEDAVLSPVPYLTTSWIPEI